jgi:hypothetical protein
MYVCILYIYTHNIHIYIYIYIYPHTHTHIIDTHRYLHKYIHTYTHSPQVGTKCWSIEGTNFNCETPSNEHGANNFDRNSGMLEIVLRGHDMNTEYIEIQVYLHVQIYMGIYVHIASRMLTILLRGHDMNTEYIEIQVHLHVHVHQSSIHQRPGRVQRHSHTHTHTTHTSHTHGRIRTYSFRNACDRASRSESELFNQSESESGIVIPQAAFNCNHCCPSPALFIEPNRLTLSKLESESESEYVH